MSEYANEPVRGLPGHLPAGEHIVWQGSPAWLPLARRAFHTHLVAGYFVVLAGWSTATALTGHTAALLPGIGVTVAVGVAAVALLSFLAFLAARATVYTITNRRIVLRFGIALPKCVNLPFAQIVSAGLKVHADGTGDLPLTVSETRLGFVHLWPNVRPWRIGTPEPMLRGLREPEEVAALLADALRAAVPVEQPAAAEAAFIPQAVAA
ncbi:MAG: PH domain-containing protein [Sphingomonadaceae bacterium]|nr:PH domain-containing protein [Sphingomonadaceae bacterium]